MLPHGRTVGYRRNLHCRVVQYIVVSKQQASILCHRNVATCQRHAVIAGTVSVSAHQHGCSRIPQEKPDAGSCTDLFAEVPFSKIGLPLQPRFRTVRHILRGEKEARFYARSMPAFVATAAVLTLTGACTNCCRRRRHKQRLPVQSCSHRDLAAHNSLGTFYLF